LPTFRKLPHPPTLKVRNRRYTIAGEHLVALGGYLWSPSESRPAGNEAIYSMRTDRWRELDVPWKDPLDRPGTVWTGRELIVVGTPCGEAYGDEDTAPYCGDRVTRALSYRPDTDEWQELRRPPQPSSRPFRQPPAIHGVGWTGREAVFRATFGTGEDSWTYDPRSDAWKNLGPVSFPGTEQRMCVADGRRVVVQKAPPPSGVESAEIVCEGNAIVAYPSMQLVPQTEILRLDPASEQWHALAPIPIAFIRASVARRDHTTVLWPIERDRSYWLLPDGASTWIPVEKPTDIDVTVENNSRFALVQEGEVDDALSLVDLLGYARDQGVSGIGGPFR
jgi:hypothetical protein